MRRSSVCTQSFIIQKAIAKAATARTVLRNLVSSSMAFTSKAFTSKEKAPRQSGPVTTDGAGRPHAQAGDQCSDQRGSNLGIRSQTGESTTKTRFDLSNTNDNYYHLRTQAFPAKQSGQRYRQGIRKRMSLCNRSRWAIPLNASAARSRAVRSRLYRCCR
jgi:hypothetical protein